MKIIVIENKMQEKFNFIDGKRADRFIEHHPTGRSWSVEIPIEPVALEEVWRGIKGDIRELIRLAKVR